MQVNIIPNRLKCIMMTLVPKAQPYSFVVDGLVVFNSVDELEQLENGEYNIYREMLAAYFVLNYIII